MADHEELLSIGRKFEHMTVSQQFLRLWNWSGKKIQIGGGLEGSSDPEIPFLIYEQTMFQHRPIGHVVGASPGLQKITLGIELNQRRRRNATLADRRRLRCPCVSRRDLARAIDHPNVIVLIDDKPRGI